MAKARPLPGLDAATALKDAAAAILITRADEVLDALKAFVDEESATALHDSRTAVRRYRTALNAFGAPLPEALRTDAQQRMKKLFKPLGKARDLDVQMELVGRRAPRLRDELLRRKERRYRKALKAAKKFLKRDVLVQVRAAVTDHLVLRVDLLPPAYAEQTLREGADQILTPLTDELLKRIKHAQEDRNPETLHQLRIGAKHERDALEMLAGALPVLGSWQKRLAKLADNLGDLHDLDVLKADIEGHRAEAKKKWQRELERLSEHVDQKRDQLLAEAEIRIAPAALDKLAAELKDARAHAFFAPEGTVH